MTTAPLLALPITPNALDEDQLAQVVQVPGADVGRVGRGCRPKSLRLRSVISVALKTIPAALPIMMSAHAVNTKCAFPELALGVAE